MFNICVENTLNVSIQGIIKTIDHTMCLLFTEQRCVPATFVPNANMSGLSVDKDAIINYQCSIGHSFSDGTTHRSGQCAGGAWNIDADECSSK